MNNNTEQRTVTVDAYTTDPREANDWQISAAVLRAVRPYNRGSAYGSERAEKCGGAVTVVRNLSTRSKSHANGTEVVDALNAAHLEALTLALRNVNNTQALTCVLTATLHLNTEEAGTAAVLLCDLLGVDPSGSMENFEHGKRVVLRRLASYAQDASDFGAVAACIRSAVLLNA